MRAKCSMCGLVMRSRASEKHTAQANMLKKIRKHCWKNHRSTMIRRIKAGKEASKNNPSAQDFIKALTDGPRAALAVYGNYTERQYQHMKTVMDAIETILPPVVRASWEAIEAIHDHQKEK